MFLMLQVLIAFVVGFLFSLGMDSIGYYIQFLPDMNETFMQYFNRKEMLQGAIGVGIIFIFLAAPLYRVTK